LRSSQDHVVRAPQRYRHPWRACSAASIGPLCRHRPVLAASGGAECAWETSELLIGRLERAWRTSHRACGSRKRACGRPKRACGSLKRACGSLKRACGSLKRAAKTRRGWDRRAAIRRINTGNGPRRARDTPKPWPSLQHFRIRRVLFLWCPWCLYRCKRLFEKVIGAPQLWKPRR